MPKMKTHSGTKKRFKVTGSGRIKRGQAYKSHILTKMSKKRKLRLRDTVLVSKVDEKRIKHLLCI